MDGPHLGKCLEHVDGNMEYVVLQLDLILIFFWLNTITIIKDICFMVLDGFGWFWMILGNGGSYHGK